MTVFLSFLSSSVGQALGLRGALGPAPPIMVAWETVA